MKKVFFLFLCLCLISCGKNSSEEPLLMEENTAVAKYDTLAIDSFSQGAVSADIAHKIRISSQSYQDSLREVQKMIAAELILKKEAEEKGKAEKAEEDQKKNTEAEKIKKEKSPASPEIPMVTKPELP
jgi:hypothetical protein